LDFDDTQIQNWELTHPAVVARSDSICCWHMAVGAKIRSPINCRRFFNRWEFIAFEAEPPARLATSSFNFQSI